MTLIDGSAERSLRRGVLLLASVLLCACGASYGGETLAEGGGKGEGIDPQIAGELEALLIRAERSASNCGFVNLNRVRADALTAELEGELLTNAVSALVSVGIGVTDGLSADDLYTALSMAWARNVVDPNKTPALTGNATKLSGAPKKAIKTFMAAVPWRNEQRNWADENDALRQHVSAVNAPLISWIGSLNVNGSCVAVKVRLQDDDIMILDKNGFSTDQRTTEGISWTSAGEPILIRIKRATQPAMGSVLVHAIGHVVYAIDHATADGDPRRYAHGLGIDPAEGYTPEAKARSQERWVNGFTADQYDNRSK